MVTLAPARPTDVDAVADLLATAFRDDPPTQAILRADGDDCERRARHLYRALILSGPLEAGTVDVAWEDDRMLGAAIWHDPHHRGDSLAARATVLPHYLAAFGPTGLWRASEIQRAVDACRPDEPHWYLHAVGVGPEARGKGVGSRLLSYRLTVADAEGVPVYLESSTADTGRLYARHGFVSQGPIEAWPDAPPHAMLRPATERATTEPTERAAITPSGTAASDTARPQPSITAAR